MSVLFSLEKRKSFSVSYEELFLICETAIRSLNLEVIRADQSAGVIEARRPSKWPFKSREQIALAVGLDSKVVAITKIDPNKLLSKEDLITERFFVAVRQLIQSST
jgi:hypothetical protein